MFSYFWTLFRWTWVEMNTQVASKSSISPACSYHIFYHFSTVTFIIQEHYDTSVLQNSKKTSIFFLNWCENWQFLCPSAVLKVLGKGSSISDITTNLMICLRHHIHGHNHLYSLLKSSSHLQSANIKHGRITSSQFCLAISFSFIFWHCQLETCSCCKIKRKRFKILFLNAI